MAKKGFIAEFKEFAMKGSIVDVAIGMIIGAAFSAISAKLPSGNAVRATGALGLPASGSGWTARYESNDPSLIDNDGNVLALPETGSVSVTVKAIVTDTARRFNTETMRR